VSITIQNLLNNIIIPWDIIMISAMKMEKADSSKTLETIYETTLQQILKGHNLKFGPVGISILRIRYNLHSILSRTV
jgi:hypothetical protein